MKPQLLIGAHTSAAGGAQNALYEGQSIGASTIQLFTSNQKRWEGKSVTNELIYAWKEALEKTEISSVMSHDSYLINLGAPDPEILIKSRVAFRQEIERCQALDITYLNFHPGSACKESPELCIQKIIESLLGFEDLIVKGSTKILLEATAGQGSAIGWRFEQLAEIIKAVEHKIPIGVCIDTCHIFAAGYDIRTPQAWDETLKAFDSIVGLKNLYAFHLNDSLKGLGSRIDRHRPLGKGEIGWEAFRFLIKDPRTRTLPMYIETPDGPPLWKEEIATLKQMAEEYA